MNGIVMRNVKYVSYMVERIIVKWAAIMINAINLPPLVIHYIFILCDAIQKHGQ